MPDTERYFNSKQSDTARELMGSHGYRRALAPDANPGMWIDNLSHGLVTVRFQVTASSYGTWLLSRSGKVLERLQ